MFIAKFRKKSLEVSEWEGGNFLSSELKLHHNSCFTKPYDIRLLHIKLLLKKTDIIHTVDIRKSTVNETHI